MHGPWDVSSERKLLLCIIGLQSKLKWNVIAERMGERFTEEACRYRRALLFIPENLSHFATPKLTQVVYNFFLHYLNFVVFPSKTHLSKMPFNWTAENERQMLLLAICAANLKPTVETWSIVAKILGGGISPSAVSQKYYKLKKESDKLAGTTSASATQVKVEATGDTAQARPASGRGRKRKHEEEEPCGSLKRMRKVPQARQDKSQGHLGSIKLEKGAVSWTSDDETPTPLQSAHAQGTE